MTSRASIHEFKRDAGELSTQLPHALLARGMRLCSQFAANTPYQSLINLPCRCWLPGWNQNYQTCQNCLPDRPEKVDRVQKSIGEGPHMGSSLASQRCLEWGQQPRGTVPICRSRLACAEGHNASPSFENAVRSCLCVCRNPTAQCTRFSLPASTAAGTT